MADAPEKTVKLVAPNGVNVTVAESKKDARLAGGYTLPKKTAAKKAASSGTTTE